MIAFLQIISYSILYPILVVFGQLEIEGLENLRKMEKPFILVSNHKSVIDPILVGATLLHNVRLFPIRFMAKDSFFFVPGFGLLIWALGAFRAYRGRGLDKSLRTPRYLLSRKSLIAIFPEGKLIKDRKSLGEGRRGAAVLAIDTHAPILPISIYTPPNLTVWRFLYTRPKFEIRVGQSFALKRNYFRTVNDAAIKRANQLIMAKIGELYFEGERKTVPVAEPSQAA